MSVEYIGSPHEARAKSIRRLFARHGLNVAWVNGCADIPGSYWGAPEAGLIGNLLYVRADSPLHSVLHEGCHYFCMDSTRRFQLHTDAGGDDLEESAVCYLSIVLADGIAEFGRARMLHDMGEWGYSFRFGSARVWFEHDADDAREWLIAKRIIDANLNFIGVCNNS
jgi:hypothetical protein